MKFSIIIPSYNGQLFIEQSLLSALNQTRSADEIIISDDNSTDATLEICSKYKNRIKIFVNKNGPSGFVNGWNNAISKSSFEYITILHQDDILAPTFLEEAEKALIANPQVKHLFVPCNYINAKGEIIEKPDYCTGETKIYTGKEYLNAYQNVGKPHIHRCPGVITHKDIFQVCKYRKEAGHIADDDFFYRVGQHTDIIGILTPLASYRIHNKSETGHLSKIEIVKKLIVDYKFQISHYQENILLSKKDLLFFKKQKRKFIKRLIGYSLKSLNISMIAYTIRQI